MTKPQLLKGYRPAKASYTIEETMLYLGVSRSTVKRLVSRDELKKSSALRFVLLTGSSVETFMDRTSN